MYGRVEGLKVCVASPDLVAARTGHSMAYGLARLGAKVTLASTSQYRLPDEVRNKLASVQGDVTEVLDSDQTSFNQLISDMHLVYLPGCSAPKGAEADAFKKMMDDYFVRYETLEDVREKEGRTIYVTHTLPRRAGEMDLRIDTTPSQLYFEGSLLAWRFAWRWSWQFRDFRQAPCSAANPIETCGLMRIVIAIDGDLLVPQNPNLGIAGQLAEITRVVDGLGELLRSEHELVVTHGNAPQIGFMLLRAELGKSCCACLTARCVWIRHAGCHGLFAATRDPQLAPAARF